MSAVTCTVTDGILVARLTNPPVNALSHAVRAGLAAALDRLAAEPGLRALLLVGEGRGFSAGADVTEFGRPMQDPQLGEVVARLESAEKPVFAALHGIVMGGGLELALASHWRLAAADARLSLPEVRLGLLPGSGGCVRLPRLIGAEAALEMIAGGTQMTGAEAAAAGLVDALLDGPPEAAALTHVARALADGAGPRRTRDIAPAPPAEGALEAARARIARKAAGQEAPLVAVDLVEMALTAPFDEAIAKEFQTCRALIASPQSRALRHLFAAERQATRPDGIPEGTEPRPVARAGVVGSGTMGRGIAQACLDAGLSVRLVGRSEAALDKARAALAKSWEAAVKRGLCTPEDVAARQARLTTGTEIAALADCDLAIETISEDMAAKRTVIAAIDAALPEGAVLATNTSFLDVEALATASTRPRAFAGLHFFNPAHIMKLVETVRTSRASPETLATLTAFARAIGKLPVMVGPGPGFVANRMLSKRTREAMFLLQDGATPAQVDRVLSEFGFPIGPFALADMAGLDVLAATRAARLPDMSPRERDCDIIERQVAAGRLGRKSGAGYYAYVDGKPQPDPAFDELIAAHRRDRGIAPRAITDDEVRERCVLAMVNEGARILEEGGAQSAADIDVIWARGMGFPAWRGGPMFYADEIGLPAVLARLEHYAGLVGPEYFDPADLIRRLVARGLGLAAATTILNEDRTERR